ISTQRHKNEKKNFEKSVTVDGSFLAGLVSYNPYANFKHLKMKILPYFFSSFSILFTVNINAQGDYIPMDTITDWKVEAGAFRYDAPGTGYLFHSSYRK